MASHTVTDQSVLKSKERQLLFELRQTQNKIRQIEKELHDLQHGLIHEREDENWIPPFIRRTDHAR